MLRKSCSEAWRLGTGSPHRKVCPRERHNSARDRAKHGDSRPQGDVVVRCCDHGVSRRAWRGRERCCGAHAGTPCDVAIPCPIARLPSKTSVAWNRPRRRFGTRRSGQDMSVLRSLESKIATLVEGTFSRAFRSEVRPVEIARKLAREMEEHRSFSVSRTYVPNEYRVFLSPQDRERFADYEEALAGGHAGYP